jgi:uncharacterized protein DUF5658
LLFHRSVNAATSSLALDVALPVTRPHFWARPLSRTVVALALVVVGLNLVDAFCTLRHISMGAEEVNPLMRRLLDLGPIAFFVGKHALASAGVLGIVAHCQHLAARRMLTLVLLPIYVAVAGYQLVLFALV